VEQIYEMLEDSLGFLTGGGRTSLPRQRTLRGALDWSHELLGEQERILFRRLSVFAGGWTLDAAEAVVPGEEVEQGDILEILSRLVDKSLIIVGTAGDGGVRYRLLEPVRQYARERLEASGEAEAVRGRHAEYFLALVEEAEPRLLGTEGATWRGHLDMEHDNLRTALYWTLDGGDTGLGLRLAGELREFWYGLGYFDEGRRWLEKALAMDDRTSAARSKALEAVGWIAYYQGDMNRAAVAAEEGLRFSAQEANEVSVAISLRNLSAVVARGRGEYDRAARLYEESLALSREAGDARRIVWCLGGMGTIEAHRGNLERATALFEESVALARKSEYTAELGRALSVLGYALLLRGDHERATTLIEESAALYREQGHKSGLEHAIDLLGWAAILGGDYEQAKAFHKESLVLSLDAGVKVITAESIEGLACAVGAEGEGKRAAKLFGAAQMLREVVGYHHVPAEEALRAPHLATARSQLDVATWEAAFAEGKAMRLEEAVEYAISEEEVSPPTDAVPEQPSTDARSPATLTRREEEIAALVARGFTNRQVAMELSISEHTVATHVSRILKKLAFRSRAELAAWVSEQLSSSDLY
jgi:predicted ATPase/DNA-binding CsgD family transcriptional regulator